MTPFVCFIVSIVVTFALTALLSRFIIPILKSHKMGQKILDVGPRWHKSKEGTPTMGGISFILSTLIVFAVLGTVFMIGGNGTSPLRLVFTFVYALLNGAIGFIDDRVKLLKKQNEGLTAAQKYLLQLLAAVLYLVAMTAFNFIDTTLYIPYLDMTFELGFVYYVFALLLLTGIVNSANLTDGLDGLASSVTFVVAAFFALAGFKADNSDVIFLSSLIIGACLGFLVYNFYPARVFMGDTGSLFLGGLTVGCAFMLGNPAIVLVAGILYLLESLSVIIQVVYFKLTHGKRFFKMAPIHHHFEKCGWSEVKVVTVFSLFTAVMCVVAYFGLK
ncbi:MAG: phospho-N-acetylmuramoyl-pentapeptide-transferase [Clostridia bacterium]|jgi:phospho-N-acetylmuramoyl-pentapeptide-transferase|nr:phospho-N-acetylmuramoyl-pentapeptide-transferase [Clostridia bacterium]